MRTNTVTGVIFGLLMVFSVSSQADGIEDALREHTPNKKVGEHIEGSGSMSSNNIDECEQRVQEAGLGNLLGAEIRYLQVTGGKCYYYGPGSSMGQGGDEVYEYSRDYGSIRQVENTTTNTEAKAGLEEELNNLRNELEAKAGLEEELNNLKGELEAKAGLEEELNNLRRKIMRGVDRAHAPMQRDNTDWYQYNKCRKINNNSEECDRFLDDGGRAQMEGSDKWYKINKSRAEKKQKRAECERVLYDGLLSNKIKECNALGYERQFDGNVKYQEPQ